MGTVLSPPEQRVVLHNVSWETYERLLAEHSDCSSPRFTFDHGELEIVTLSPEHARYNIRLAELLGIQADEMDLEVEALGSTTFKRQELERGFEPAPVSTFRTLSECAQKTESILRWIRRLTWSLKWMSRALRSASSQCWPSLGFRRCGASTVNSCRCSA